MGTKMFVGDRSSHFGAGIPGVSLAAVEPQMT